MDIRLKNLIPKVMSNMTTSPQGIWRNEVFFKASTHNIINAASGKGKTSFTKLLSGILVDFEGELYFGDKRIHQLSFNEWTQIRKNDISVVYQDLQLFSNLTVKENLQLLAKLYSNDTIIELGKEYCLFLKIDDKWDLPCKNLSMGQQQRVAIVRSLIRPFKWLILDEPFSHLDAENSRLAYDLIVKRVDEINAGFILTSLDEGAWNSIDKTYQL